MSLINRSLRRFENAIIIKHKEIKEISGLKVGIVEKLIGDTEIKNFFTGVNDEILMCELKGDTNHHEYICVTFDEILYSIKKK